MMSGKRGAPPRYDDDKQLLAFMKGDRAAVHVNAVMEHFGWDIFRARRAFYALRDEGLATRHAPADGGPIVWVLT